MKRFLLLAGIFSALFAGGFALQAYAQDETIPMTEAHIARIKANCVDAQATLQQLHASDALLRVNRGRLYELISTKLMAPFNSRVALNRLDGVVLVGVAAKYESQLAAFRTNYQVYEEAMSRTLKLNCINQPVSFYDSVSDTRSKRKKVHESTTALHATIREYGNEFEVFARDIEGKSK